MSIVRDNMMSSKYYTPYCGRCNTMCRTIFNGKQMECKICGWQSTFEDEFIKAYKEKHFLKKLDYETNN